MVPKESLSNFIDRMNHFIKAHGQHKPQTLANWAYWKMDEGAAHSVIGGGTLPGLTMSNSSRATEICLKKSHDILNIYRPPPMDLLDSEIGPLVCIIVPTYNVEEYVERSLQSIRHQTYPNFQVVVVDDSSTDLTRDKINKYVQSDQRFRLVHLTHNTAGGAGQPTNIGLDSCSKDAEYILIADGDDWMERDALESLLFDARRFHSDIVIADFDIFIQQDYSSGCNGTDLDGSSLDLFNRTSIEQFCNETASAMWPFKFTSSYDSVHFDTIPTEQVFTFFTHPSVLRTSPVSWRKLYRKSFIERFGLRFLEGDIFFEDNAFHWMTVFYARRITKVDRVLFHHMRNREGQVTLAMTSKQELMGSKSMQFKVNDNYQFTQV
ncbi:hypothetical protein ACHAW5_003838 [Stephanodiscus triporus]|uniref:Glycosyltransferase 2-like domain-containing protein n=1 Tax=Stephanodiscus triporus TaxID=2934178 RepID=A0ABD3P9C8_9STRA